jgi:uncharacterized protein (TIGR03086 family)
MTTRISELMAASAARTVPVVQSVEDGQLDDRTPCDDFRVRDLLNHLFQVVVSFQALASREVADFSTTPDAIEGDWRGRFAEETGRLATAWSNPAALEGVSPGMGMPQPIVGNMALLDLIVHGWDLAKATGQAYDPDPDAVAAVHPVAEQLAPQARSMGVFGAAADTGPDAGPFERLLALTGRKPEPATAG